MTPVFGYSCGFLSPNECSISLICNMQYNAKYKVTKEISEHGYRLKKRHLKMFHLKLVL